MKKDVSLEENSPSRTTGMREFLEKAISTNKWGFLSHKARLSYEGKQRSSLRLAGSKIQTLRESKFKFSAFL